MFTDALLMWFILVFFDFSRSIVEEFYNDYYDNYNYTDSEMSNSSSIVQDHRQLTGWSEAGSDTAHMPLDMTFNDGHRLSIIVYR